jgi:cation diffusion facilitator CzcD-associated flavoprotein CzcO
MPEVPGIDTFPGAVFHTAQWDHDHDLSGERVAVIGTGASAIQVVPSIAPIVGHLTLFQRTPPWLLPRPDRAFGDRERALHSRFPALTNAVRNAIYYAHESWTLGLVRQPKLMKVAEKQALAQLRKQVPDPVLRAKLTPSYLIGCKRILLSSNYYPALTRSNVSVLATGLARVEGSTLIGNDGSRVEVDTIIFATGFAATDPPIAHHVRGRDGRTMAETFAAEGMRALRGVAFPGFPNLFMLVGPNTGVGHTSMVQIIEAQVTYVLDALRAMRQHRIGSLEATSRALEEWNSDVQHRMQGTVWQQGGCASWYQDAHGRNTTLWPGSTIRFRHELEKIDLREYVVAARQAELASV